MWREQQPRHAAYISPRSASPVEHGGPEGSDGDGRAGAHPGATLAAAEPATEGRPAGEVHAEPERDDDGLLPGTDERNLQTEDVRCSSGHSVPGASAPLVNIGKKRRIQLEEEDLESIHRQPS